MRMSVDSDDPGFKNLRIGSLVFLWDIKVNGVFTVDEERGLIIAVKRDRHGKVLLANDEFGQPKVERRVLYGRVRIEPPA